MLRSVLGCFGMLRSSLGLSRATPGTRNQGASKARGWEIKGVSYSSKGVRDIRATLLAVSSSSSSSFFSLK